MFVASSGAKDSLMLISLHLSPQAASCLPQLLMHFLFFLCFSPSFSLLVVRFSASFFVFLLSPLPSHMAEQNKGERGSGGNGR